MRPRKLIVFIFILLASCGCENQLPEISPGQHELLVSFSGSFKDSTNALFYKTLEKSDIGEYIGAKITRELLTVNPVFSDMNLDSIFTEIDFNELNKEFQTYHSFELDTLRAHVSHLVTEEQIPDFIISKALPIGEVEFYNVSYISSPITTSNRGIVFTRSTSGHAEMNIHFFVKEVNTWKRVGWTFTYPDLPE